MKVISDEPGEAGRIWTTYYWSLSQDSGNPLKVFMGDKDHMVAWSDLYFEKYIFYAYGESIIGWPVDESRPEDNYDSKVRDDDSLD